MGVKYYARLNPISDLELQAENHQVGAYRLFDVFVKRYSVGLKYPQIMTFADHRRYEIVDALLDDGINLKSIARVIPVVTKYYRPPIPIEWKILLSSDSADVERARELLLEVMRPAKLI